MQAPRAQATCPSLMSSTIPRRCAPLCSLGIKTPSNRNSLLSLNQGALDFSERELQFCRRMKCLATVASKLCSRRGLCRVELRENVFASKRCAQRPVISDSRAVQPRLKDPLDFPGRFKDWAVARLSPWLLVVSTELTGRAVQDGDTRHAQPAAEEAAGSRQFAERALE